MPACVRISLHLAQEFCFSLERASAAGGIDATSNLDKHKAGIFAEYNPSPNVNHIISVVGELLTAPLPFTEGCLLLLLTGILTTLQLAT